jgi:hypothetical protein
MYSQGTEYAIKYSIDKIFIPVGYLLYYAALLIDWHYISKYSTENAYAVLSKNLMIQSTASISLIPTQGKRRPKKTSFFAVAGSGFILTSLLPKTGEASTCAQRGS